MKPQSGENDPIPAARSAAAATIARVLEQIGVVRPARVDFQTGAKGMVLARVLIEQNVSEILCELTSEGDLISARLIEL